MDVCGHNESDVELNLRTLREKKTKNRNILSFLLFCILKNMYEKIFVCKSLKEKTLKPIPSRNNYSYNKLYLL